MFKIALKGILARKGRLLLTSLAVILGTSFLAGTYIFSDTLTKSFNDLFADVFDRHRRVRALVGRHQGRLRAAKTASGSPIR